MNLNLHINYFEGRLAEFLGKSLFHYTSKMLITTRFSFSYLGSFFSLNTYWQTVCDKYFNLDLQSTLLLSLNLDQALKKHSRETEDDLLPTMSLQLVR